MLNYVILSTHSSHHYSMWDFTHICIPNNPPLHMWVSTSLWASRPLHGSWKSSTRSLLPNELFPSLMHHPWTSTCQHHMSFILHWNLAPYHCLAQLAIILICWVFLKIVCVVFMGLLGAIYLPYSICEMTSSTHTLFLL